MPFNTQLVSIQVTAYPNLISSVAIGAHDYHLTSNNTVWLYALNLLLPDGCIEQMNSKTFWLVRFRVLFFFCFFIILFLSTCRRLHCATRSLTGWPPTIIGIHNPSLPILQLVLQNLAQHCGLHVYFYTYQFTNHHQTASHSIASPSSYEFVGLFASSMSCLMGYRNHYEIEKKRV